MGVGRGKRAEQRALITILCLIFNSPWQHLGQYDTFSLLEPVGEVPAGFEGQDDAFRTPRKHSRHVAGRNI